MELEITFKMEKCHSEYCFNWKFTGKAIGWIGIIASIGLGIYFIPLFGLYGKNDAFVLTLMFSFGEFFSV